MAQSQRTVLILLFVVLGPVALPLLWQSPRFSPLWKVILTILVVIQTALVVLIAWYTIDVFIVAPLKEHGII